MFGNQRAVANTGTLCQVDCETPASAAVTENEDGFVVRTKEKTKRRR